MYNPGWHGCLVGKEGRVGLLDRYDYEYGKIIIYRADTRSFRMFDDYLDFGNYLFSVPPEQRVFFEIIWDTAPQKFYLDVDATTDQISLEDSVELAIYLCDELVKFFLEITSKVYPILVFSSHGDEKLSYHIVVDKVCVINNIQNRILFEKFMSRLDDRSRFIDASLFKKKQQMRIWTCTKYLKNRFKALTNLSRNEKGGSWKAIGTREKEIFLYTLSSSLISNTRLCEIIPPEPEPIKKKIYSESNALINVDSDVVENVLEIYRIHHNLKRCPLDFFEVCQEENSRAMILCKRNAPSYCEKCQRVHEHENPYFLVYGELYTVLFYCRRSDQPTYLGNLKEEEEEEEEEHHEEHHEKESYHDTEEIENHEIERNVHSVNDVKNSEKESIVSKINRLDGINSSKKTRTDKKRENISKTMHRRIK